MAMIQNTNEVHFTGMTRVELEGNKIIATQNGESQVTIAANTRSLAELAGKINESTAKKETVTDQEMLDMAIIESYRGYCTPRKYIKNKYWCAGHRMDILDFIKFYLSANRLGYSLWEMRQVLVSLPSNPEDGIEYKTGDCSVMSITYLESKIRKAAEFARTKGFELPKIKNDPAAKMTTVEDQLQALNWAS